jgi:hypothetical protein
MGRREKLTYGLSCFLFRQIHFVVVNMVAIRHFLVVVVAVRRPWCCRGSSFPFRVQLVYCG